MVTRNILGKGEEHVDNLPFFDYKRRYFQHDEASSHNNIVSTEYLNARFAHRELGTVIPVRRTAIISILVFWKYFHRVFPKIKYIGNRNTTNRSPRSR